MSKEIKSWIKTLGYIFCYTAAYILLISLLKFEFNPSSYSIGLSAFAIYLGFLPKQKREEEIDEKERQSSESFEVTAKDARLLMGGQDNAILKEIYSQIREQALAGKTEIIKSLNPGECNIGYIGDSLESSGFIVEIDRTIKGPDFYFIISWDKK